MAKVHFDLLLLGSFFRDDLITKSVLLDSSSITIPCFLRIFSGYFLAQIALSRFVRDNLYGFLNSLIHPCLSANLLQIDSVPSATFAL